MIIPKAIIMFLQIFVVMPNLIINNDFSADVLSWYYYSSPVIDGWTCDTTCELNRNDVLYPYNNNIPGNVLDLDSTDKY